jgi:hypothetical protein
MPWQAMPSTRKLMPVLPNCQLARSAVTPGAVADRADAHRQAGQVVVADLERAEKALQALVVGVHLGLAAEAGGQFGEADAAHFEQSRQELGEEACPRAVPGQVFGQDGLEVADRVVRGGSHRGGKKRLVYPMAIN